MYLTTKGLVLREVNYRESDKILTLLTAETGKLTVSARGCRKKGSPIGAASQLLVWSEWTLYQRLGQWVAKEAVLQRSFEGMRGKLEKLALASYFAEVCEGLCGEGQREAGLLSLILNSAHALEKLPYSQSRIKAVFEWKAMALAGYEPRAEGCTICGRELPEHPRIHLREGILCCACCGHSAGGMSMPLTPTALAALRHVVWGNPKRLFSFPIDQTGLLCLGKAAEAYLLTQLERGFRTLDFYQSLNLEKLP